METQLLLNIEGGHLLFVQWHYWGNGRSDLFSSLFVNAYHLFLSTLVSHMCLFPMQDELETHSESGSLSVFVHYGGDRTHDPQYIAEPDVVLTTYGILGTAYSNVYWSDRYYFTGFMFLFLYLFNEQY